jgi:glycosyltransferase involved in cell wall biosynthesis
MQAIVVSLALEPVEENRIDCLYLTYEGLLRPTGGAQIVDHLVALGREGICIAVVSCERADDLKRTDHVVRVRKRLSVTGVEWFPKVGRSGLLGTRLLFDMLSATATASAIARRRSPKLIHAHSYVAGVTALGVRKLTKARFVFDMNGFWPEERVELGEIRPSSLTYRLTKVFERVLLERADHVVVLTETAKELLRERDANAILANRRIAGAPISVIPCGADLQRFHPHERASEHLHAPESHEEVEERELRHRYGLEETIVLGHASGGTDRYLSSEMFRFVSHVKRERSNVRFVYLTPRSEQTYLSEVRAAGLSDDDVMFRRVDPAELPGWVRMCRLGVFFLRPGFAAKGSSFTALGEFLGSGVPLVTNAGVGDLANVLGNAGAGIVLPGLTDRELSRAARGSLRFLDGAQPDPEVVARCREVAESHYALQKGAKKYSDIYRGLLDEPATLRDRDES